MTTGLSADQRTVLAVYAAATAPVDMFDMRDVVLTRPSRRDARTREHREWTKRSLELFGAWLDLHNAGLICERDDYDESGNESVITDAGRIALAGLKSPGGRSDA